MAKNLHVVEGETVMNFETVQGRVDFLKSEIERVAPQFTEADKESHWAAYRVTELTKQLACIHRTCDDLGVSDKVKW